MVHEIITFNETNLSCQKSLGTSAIGLPADYAYFSVSLFLKLTSLHFSDLKLAERARIFPVPNHFQSLELITISLHNFFSALQVS